MPLILMTKNSTEPRKEICTVNGTAEMLISMRITGMKKLRTQHQLRISTQKICQIPLLLKTQCEKTLHSVDELQLQIREICRTHENTQVGERKSNSQNSVHTELPQVMQDQEEVEAEVEESDEEISCDVSGVFTGG